jgi:hypothetical protein
MRWIHVLDAATTLPKLSPVLDRNYSLVMHAMAASASVSLSGFSQ